MKKQHIVQLVLLPFLLLGIAIGGCKGTIAPSDATLPSAAQFSGTLRGVGLSPRSSSGSDFTGFFQKAKEAGSVVMWAGDWNELNAPNGGPAVVAGLAAQYRYTPVIEAQLFTQANGKLIRPLDGDTRQVYKTSAAAFAKKNKLKYFGLGIEVNILYEKSPVDFETFAGFFSEVYDAVKEASPDTQVFTVFQLEKLKGLNGGLFGGTNDPGKTDWDLLARFPKADMFAFTTYPGLIYKDPDDIPENYYTDIMAHTDKPIVFTEIGWHSEASPAGWESSQAEQAAFVTRFFELTPNLMPRMAVWSFLYDQATSEPFRSMGLIRSDGTAKAAWEEWINGK